MTSDKIEKLLVEIRNVIDYVKEKLTCSPDGFLYTRCINGVVRYYKRTSGTTCGKYLGKDSQETVRALEEKNYYSLLLKTAIEEEHVLLNIQKELESIPDYNSVFLSIPLEKRHLITSYRYIPEEKKDDLMRIYIKKPVSEEIKLITQNGEHVRSKSELIIADRLLAAGVPYYYEDPLILADEKNRQGALVPCQYWYPDFRVQNIRTGKEYYWEHFGMLDNPEYLNSCQGRLEIYAKNGYFPGDNLIITSESSHHGLNLEYVDCIITRFLK